MKSIYLIGSLRNKNIPIIGNKIRALGIEAFDDWYSAGEFADDSWRDHEISKGHNYRQALEGFAAKHVFSFDYHHLNRCDAGVLILPAGKSGHLELGFMAGLGKKTYILLDGDPERFDVMYQFATKVFYTEKEMLDEFELVCTVVSGGQRQVVEGLEDWRKNREEQRGIDRPYPFGDIRGIRGSTEGFTGFPPSLTIRRRG